MSTRDGRPYGLLTIARAAELLGLSEHQMYRLASNPPAGFPPPLALEKREKMLFSSVLIEAWLAGQDVSAGALPHLANPVPPPSKRAPGRPRKQAQETSAPGQGD